MCRRIALTSLSFCFIFWFTSSLTWGDGCVEAGKILGKDTLVWVQIDDAPDFIRNSKEHYHDKIYAKSKEILPLNLGLVYKQRRHWLLDSFNALRSQSDAIAECKDLLTSIVKRGKVEREKARTAPAKPPEEKARPARPEKRVKDEPESDFDEVLYTLESFFTGRVFFAVEPRGSRLNYLFGFDFEADSFDWISELKACCKRANDEALKPAAVFEGVEVFYLKHDNFYFFEIESAVYGISTSDIGDCGGYISRILGTTVVETAIVDKRSFSRVVSTLDQPNECDLFFYADIARFAKAFKFDLESIRALTWGDHFGLSMKWGSGPNLLTYRISAPMVFPPKKRIADMLGTIDLSHRRSLLPLGCSCFCEFENAQEAARLIAAGPRKADPYLFSLDDNGEYIPSNAEQAAVIAFEQAGGEGEESCSFGEKGSIWGAIARDKPESPVELGEVIAEELNSIESIKSPYFKRKLEFSTGAAGSDAARLVDVEGGSLFFKDDFCFLSLYANESWTKKLRQIDLAKTFSAREWLGDESREVDGKVLVIQNSFCNFISDGALRPIGIVFSRLLSRVQRNVYAGRQDAFYQGKLSFLTVLARYMANEFRSSYADGELLARAFGSSVSFELHHLHMLGLDKSNELNVLYRGVIREDKP